MEVHPAPEKTISDGARSLDLAQFQKMMKDLEPYIQLWSESRKTRVAETGANFDVGSPIALFQASPRQAIALFDLFVYDVSRDGQRFLINTPVKQAETEPMSVVLNWTAKLNK